MRPLILLALLVSVTVAFNVLRGEQTAPEEQEQLLVFRQTRDVSSDSSDSDEDKETEGSGSGEESLRRVARDVGDGSGDGSGSEVASAPVRFVRSVDVEGSGSGEQ